MKTSSIHAKIIENRMQRRREKWHLEIMEIVKKTMFEKITLFIVIIMLVASLLGIFATAIGALSNL